MIPIIVCFIFGHDRFSRVNIRDRGTDGFCRWYTYDEVMNKYCSRCGKKLLTISQECGK